MKQDDIKKKGKITKDAQGRVVKRTDDAAIDKLTKNIMDTTPGITRAAARKQALVELGRS